MQSSKLTLQFVVLVIPSARLVQMRGECLLSMQNAAKARSLTDCKGNTFITN